MPPPPLKAFISYAHRYRPWITTLARNLETCLESAGAKPEIFLDTTDLASGRSWVAQLQEGLAKADQLILVATPEALASPRVEDEWEAFINLRRDWAKGALHVVMLVDVPLPAFLERIQRLDFVEHDEEQYRRELQKLSGGLLGRGTKVLPELPGTVEIPPPPAGTLATSLRHQLVAWLAPQVERKLVRRAVADTLGIERNHVEGHPTPEAAASAALVAATGDDDRTEAARRIVRALREAFEDEDENLLAELDAIADELCRVAPGVGDSLLATWLAKVGRDHSNLVPFFEHADLELLDRVYVALELRPEERLLRGKESAFTLERRQLTVRDLLALERGEHPWVTGRWMVLGDPGAGKTTLLRHLAAKLSGEEGRQWVPVFESLPRLMKKPEWLLDRLEREMRKGGEAVRGLASALDREAQEGRLLLLLDGLDEVPREDREDAEALLRQLSARWPKTAIVVTSRPIGYRRPGSEYVELELLPFDKRQREEFLGRWFGRGSPEPDRERAAEVMTVLSSDASLWDLSSNPLYLTLMALLFEEGKEPERNRATLYDQVFALLLEGRHRPGGRPIDAKKAVYGALRRLAYDMTRDNADAEPRSEIEARLLEERYDELLRPLRRVPAWQSSLSPLLDDLAEKVGILGPHDGPQADWRYWHRTFREALTAERLAEELETGGESAILERAAQVEGDESRWAEPFALLVGRVEDPDALVTSLSEANRALGLRAVATAQRLADDTVASVLRLSEKPSERSEVYRAVPELMGEDPERALALLDRLRRRTRDGNDLYFLRETVAEVARRWPGANRQAAQLEKRFFDHIPPPPEELFGEIDTPIDGQVPLWRTIPAGTFEMGTPEGEEKSGGWEWSQHLVTITSAFRIGAVPVTNAQYGAFDPDFSREKWAGVPREELAHHPVFDVSWYQAVSFCRWLSDHLPGARLPTEEEWEYACRAGTRTRYWSGDEESDLDRVGWYKANSDRRSHCVGEKPANPHGLYDVHGNVFEWTRSPWSTDFSQREAGVVIEPRAEDDLESGGERVVRGGGFFDGAQLVRSACRDWDLPVAVLRDVGFRVVLPASPSEP